MLIKMLISFCFLNGAPVYNHLFSAKKFGNSKSCGSYASQKLIWPHKPDTGFVLLMLISLWISDVAAISNWHKQFYTCSFWKDACDCSPLRKWISRYLANTEWYMLTLEFF